MVKPVIDVLSRPIGVVKVEKMTVSRNKVHNNEGSIFYRIRKKVKGKYVHICCTRNFAAGLVAFDLFCRKYNLIGELNFSEVPVEMLEMLLKILDLKAYKKVLGLK